MKETVARLRAAGFEVWSSPDEAIVLLIGDVLDRLRDLPDESVHCVVTSPPYWGLRDYGTATWEGGDAECDHRQTEVRQRRNLAEAANACDGGNRTSEGRADKDAIWIPYRDVCGKCGARRIDQQIGLEKTPDEFVAKMVAVFREVRRVLRSDGTCWMNLGDSYNGSGNPAGCTGRRCDGGQQAAAEASNQLAFRNGSIRVPGLKPKDIVGIPWRVAFALQVDGWWLRQDIIWHKPNPMPESVTDRCTKAHEYIFLLTKSARYFYDAEAVKEEGSQNTHSRGKAGLGPELFDSTYKMESFGSGNRNNPDFQRHMADRPLGTPRNRRSVWTIPTQAYPEAHFATYPVALVEPCIKAGCPQGGTVLDPFAGSGTTLQVARILGRQAIGIELNPEYAELAKVRAMSNYEGNDDTRPLFEPPPKRQRELI